MIRKIYTLLILGLCLGFAACSDDNDGLDPNAADYLLYLNPHPVVPSGI